MNDPDETTAPGFIEQPAQPRTTTPSGARRVPPNESKPRLSARKEAALAPADATSAAGYDALEAAGERIEALAQAIADGAVQGELMIDDSLVIRLSTEILKGDGGK